MSFATYTQPSWNTSKSGPFHSRLLLPRQRSTLTSSHEQLTSTCRPRAARIVGLGATDTPLSTILKLSIAVATPLQPTHGSPLRGH